MDGYIDASALDCDGRGLDPVEELFIAVHDDGERSARRTSDRYRSRRFDADIAVAGDSDVILDLDDEFVLSIVADAAFELFDGGGVENILHCGHGGCDEEAVQEGDHHHPAKHRCEIRASFLC